VSAYALASRQQWTIVTGSPAHEGRLSNATRLALSSGIRLAAIEMPTGATADFMFILASERYLASNAQPRGGQPRQRCRESPRPSHGAAIPAGNRRPLAVGAESKT